MKAFFHDLKMKMQLLGIAVAVVSSLILPVRAWAQVFDHSKVGIEFEYEATRNSSRNDTRNHEALLGFLQREFGGKKIVTRPWEKFVNARGTFQAEFKDALGRQWAVVPEKMNGETFDGFELITPPLTTEEDVKRLGRAIDAIHASGMFVRGYSSSTHFNYDVSHLTGSLRDSGLDRRNVAELVDAILFLETHVVQILEIVRPERYDHVVNKFAVPLAVNQKDLLRELAELPREHRTFGNVRAIFQKYEKREIELVNGNKVHAWKFRAFNYAKLLGIGEFKGWNLPIIESRLADLVENSAKLEEFGRLFARSIATGAATPVTQFRDPFPQFNEFYEHSRGHAALDEFIRGTHPDRVSKFRARIGLSAASSGGGAFSGGRCEALFVPKAG